jgi:GT2 family glycosyltransferase
MMRVSTDIAACAESSSTSQGLPQAWQSLSHHRETALENATISVIVPVHNGGSAFRLCLLSLSRFQPTPLEVIVVADGDTQNSAALAKEFGFNVLSLPSRGGPARARNAGAAHARGDFLLFIDADVECPSDTVGRVRDIFQGHSTIAAVFGSYDDQPADGGFLSQYKNLFHHYIHQNANEEAFTFWGACGAIRRETFMAVDGFSEAYTSPCIEDIDLGIRLKRAGYSIRLCKELQVKHLKAWGPLSLLRTDFLCRALPWSALILKNRLAVNDLNLRTASRFSLVATYAMLASILATIWWPLFAVTAAAILAITLLAINAPFYGFFARKRGLWFALKTVPWHWFYYLYGGLAFAISLARHLAGAGRRSRMSQTTVRTRAGAKRN